jgi:hypothetical protein
MPDVQIHNPWALGEGGWSIVYLQIQKLRLESWKIIQLRGDRRGPMADRVIPLPDAARRRFSAGVS